jgi:hypothetical protein
VLRIDNMDRSHATLRVNDDRGYVRQAGRIETRWQFGVIAARTPTTGLAGRSCCSALLSR